MQFIKCTHRPFAALSLLISYSTSMIVSYYLCFTSGLFIERAEQLTLLFSESVCLRPAGLYTKCQTNLSKNHSIQEGSDFESMNRHPPVFTHTPVIVMGITQGYADVSAGTACVLLTQCGQDSCQYCVRITRSWSGQTRLPFIF